MADFALQNYPMDERQQFNPNQGLIDALENELQNLDACHNPAIYSVVENELFRLRGNVTEWIDVVNQRRCKLRAKVDIPIDVSNQVNYVGKLIGPGGKNLKTLQETTGTKMSILGHGSMRNVEKEAEYLATGDPKFMHLKGKLHLQIDSSSDPADAFYRMSHALIEVKKFMAVDNSNNSYSTNGGSHSNTRGRGRGGSSSRNNGGSYGDHQQRFEQHGHYQEQEQSSTGQSDGFNKQFNNPYSDNKSDHSSKGFFLSSEGGANNWGGKVQRGRGSYRSRGRPY